MKINLPIDYIAGHLRYGHFEGEIDLTKEEIKDFKDLLEIEYDEARTLSDEDANRLDEYKEKVLDNCELIIDSYRVDDRGDIYWEELMNDLRRIN